MKRANCMNVKLNTLLYIALFSGLGIFSFLLLINYATFSDRVADMLHSVSTLGFFILAFNVLGYTTIRLSSWIDNQYALNLHRRWKLVSVYIIVMGMFLLLNYGNCQVVGRSFLSVYVSQRRLADSYNCMAGRARHPWIVAGQSFHA